MQAKELRSMFTGEKKFTGVDMKMHFYKALMCGYPIPMSSLSLILYRSTLAAPKSNMKKIPGNN